MVKSPEDLKECREIIDRLEELSVPAGTIEGLRAWLREVSNPQESQEILPADVGKVEDIL